MSPSELPASSEQTAGRGFTGKSANVFCGGYSQERTAARDECIIRVVTWLRKLSLAHVHASGAAHVESQQQGIASALNAVLGSGKRQTFQQTKAYKHRAQIEAIASHCLRCLPGDCEAIVELGAGQAVLGHSVSLASRLPLVAIERRGNTDAFDTFGTSANEHQDPAGSADASGPAVISSRRVQADIADEEAWPKRGQVALLAKHLCGHSSDEAVSAAVTLGERLSLLCLAPCCHATMQWGTLEPESQQWFKAADFPGDVAEFALLTDIIRLARVGEQGGVACAKWRLRNHLQQDEIETLGRRACRAIDEARLSRLCEGGLSVALVEYCSSKLTPDNVLILAAPPSGPALVPSAPSPTDRMKCEEELGGVLLELDPTGPPSLPQRLAAYLLELQAAGHLPALRSVTPAVDAQAAQVPALLCGAIGVEKAPELLQQLTDHILVQRVSTRLLPFQTRTADLDALVAAIDEQVEKQVKDGVTGPTFRVSARPRKLEGVICKALKPDLLAPSRFTHTLSVTQGQGNGDLCFSLMPRALLDPSALADARRADDAARAYWRYAEVGMRWPSRFQGSAAVALWSDTSAAATTDCPNTWLLRWAEKFLPGSDACVAEMRPRVSSSGWGSSLTTASDIEINALRGLWRPTGDGREDGARATTLLLDLGCSGEAAIAALRSLLKVALTAPSPPVATSGTAVVRLHCGRRARAVKKWLKDTSRQIETDLGAQRIELLHLLCDRETERTAVFTWSGLPPPLPEKDTHAGGVDAAGMKKVPSEGFAEQSTGGYASAD